MHPRRPSTGPYSAQASRSFGLGTCLPVMLAALLSLSPCHAQVATNLDAITAPKTDAPAAKKARPGAGKTQVTKVYSKPRAAETEASPQDTVRLAARPDQTPVAPPRPPSQQQARRLVGPPPSVPTSPPPNVVIRAPQLFVPTHPPVPPKPVIPDAGAANEIKKTSHGLKITFAPQKTTLGPKALAKLEKYAKSLARAPQIRVTIRSWASGQADDPSVPRRVSLARALVVRSVLINGGVATTRIYPRAEGLPTTPIASPDMLEVTAEGAAPAPPSDAHYPLLK